MSAKKLNPKVDSFISKSKNWKNEIEAVRHILLDCGLTEEIKWGQPCYLFENNNIVIIQAFKQYFALGFFKGALIKDSKNLLTAPGENSQAMRQFRISDVNEINYSKSILINYINEAIAIEKNGLKIEFKKNTELSFPEEFQKKLEENPDLKTAFEALTPGRQRAYNLYFSAPKQSKTRESRIEKYIERILCGKGINDR